jgi:hypothetical protein
MGFWGKVEDHLDECLMPPQCSIGETKMVENRPNAAVTCPQCGAEIRFFKEPKLREGFSLACPRCARRKIYALADIHIPKDSDQRSRPIT